MKISIVLGPFHPLPPLGYGAVEKVWHEIADALARLGHDVVVVGKGGAGCTDPHSPPSRSTIALPGFTASPWLARNLLADLHYALQVTRTLTRSDVIVTNSFWTPVVLAIFGRGLGPVVVHVARFPKGQMGLYRGAAVLHAVSGAVAIAIAEQAPALRDKVRVLPYPIDTTVFHPPEVPRRRGGTFTILYVGRVHPEKGLAMLVRAFRALAAQEPSARLRIVGPWDVDSGGGGAGFLEALRSEAGDAPVTFAEPVSDPRILASEFRRANCFCYPSVAERGEAFGLAPLEAMATGLPVVVSALECFRDFVQPGRNGLVFDHRGGDAPARLAAALRELVRDPQAALALGANAAQTAREFDLKPVSRRYLALFEEVAANARGGKC